MNQAEFHIRPISPILQQQKENEIHSPILRQIKHPQPKNQKPKKSNDQPTKKQFPLTYSDTKHPDVPYLLK